jgi:hypothetical protein
MVLESGKELTVRASATKQPIENMHGNGDPLKK